MRSVNGRLKFFSTDYENLDDGDKQYVYGQFVDECLDRIRWVTVVAFLGEAVLMNMDFLAGFFEANPLNYLNLFAELLIIFSSLIVYLQGQRMYRLNEKNVRKKALIIGAYKYCLFFSVALFIFTDVYVRQSPLGAYIVFFFIFQIVPFYRWIDNAVIFGIYSLFISGLYLMSVPNADAAALFSIIFIYVAFGLSTECLRSFFIKKIVNNQISRLMTMRFEKLATQTIMALANAVEAKDLYTKGHSQRVAKYSREIAKRMGYDREKQSEIYYIGLLHDIGKIGVRDSVINKNGRLDEEEYAEIKKHPNIGYDIMKNITEIQDISMGAKSHHERYDGAGYPDGLKGEEIPKIARIIAVADAYDAMTSTRSYREVLPQAVVREEIEKNSGKQFDPEIAQIMLKMIDEDKDYRMRKPAGKQIANSEEPKQKERINES